MPHYLGLHVIVNRDPQTNDYATVAISWYIVTTIEYSPPAFWRTRRLRRRLLYKNMEAFVIFNKKVTLFSVYSLLVSFTLLAMLYDHVIE